MKYPKHEIYEEIYKRYFKRSVYDLIQLADIKKEDNVLDLCGGNGRLTKELVKFSNHVSYLDQEKDMTPDDLKDFGITVYHQSVQDFIDTTFNKYHIVFCQQAINYWLLHIDLQKFSHIFQPKATFIFNTFKNKPSEKPMIKSYEINGKEYLEISYLIENQVHHIQIEEGYPPHETIFDWIDEATFYEKLSPYFEVDKVEDKKTVLYKCRKK